VRILYYLIALWFCAGCKTSSREEPLPFLNLHDSVTYVGMDACRSCHSNVYDDFIHTGMGQSFGVANREKSAALFGEQHVVYDSLSNFWYRPFFRGDSLLVMEYRLKPHPALRSPLPKGEGSRPLFESGAEAKTDTIYKRIEFIAYIIGSGHHTNSHIVNVNGRLFQAPITYYTQRKTWDLAPGFENGFNSRFARVITMECLSCHNALPEPVAGSENKYQAVPLGITCERCHGPGSLHVKEKLAGKVVDTAKGTDYTIVNPRQLPISLQTDVCERCHLQGVTVLNEGKSFADFRPAMKLAEVMHVFLPREKDRFLMASQADRLRQSACYAPGELSCITCHNPHVSVKIDQTARFNSACKNCHDASVNPQHKAGSCTESMQARQLKQDNCNGCHMPKSGSIDIPHVSITDHNIQIPGRPRSTSSEGALVCVTDDDPSPLLMARGYLRFYQGFASSPSYLDSAERYLNLSNESMSVELNAWIELHYLRGDYRRVVDLARDKTITDPYTLFRRGDAFLELGHAEEAVKWLKKAVNAMPLHLEFLNKLGSAQFTAGQLPAARATFQTIVFENPKDDRARYNLGFTALNLGDYATAEIELKECIALNPDYEMAYLNLAKLYQVTGKGANLEQVLQRLLQNMPESELGREMLRGI
jgi:hypothetical protein